MPADLELVLSQFLDSYAARTREAYAADLRQWLAWLEQEDVPTFTARRGEVKKWAATLRAAGRANGTIARKLSAVAGFYNEAVDLELMAANPAAGIKRPKVSQESPRAGLDQPEFERLLATAAAAGPAEDVLVRLLGLNGLRVSEACAIRVQDLGIEDGITTVAIVGKGGKPARPPLHASTAAAVRRLVDARRLGQTDHVLPYDRFSAKRRVVQLVAAAGITGKRITPHSLRHTFVTLALARGVPLHDVQDSARHADPRTTQRYNRARHNLHNHATFALADALMPATPTHM